MATTEKFHHVKLDPRDLAAVARHVEWLQREPAALSLTASLPSGLPVTVFKDGTVKA